MTDPDSLPCHAPGGAGGAAEKATLAEMEAYRDELTRELSELRAATPSVDAVRQREALARRNVAAAKRSIETLNLRSLRSQLSSAGRLEASIDAMQNDIVKITLQVHLMHHRGRVVADTGSDHDEMREVVRSFLNSDELSEASLVFREFLREVVTYGSR